MSFDREKYAVLADGKVFSYRKKKYLKVQENGQGRYVRMISDKRRRIIYLDDLKKTYNDELPETRILFGEISDDEFEDDFPGEVDEFGTILCDDSLMYYVIIVLLLFLFFLVKESLTVVIM